MAKKQFRQLIKFSIIFLLITTISGAVSFYSLLTTEDDFNTVDKTNTKKQEDDTKVISEFNVLLMGADQEQNGQARSDTLMIANINLEAGEVSILSIPRDTRVKFEDGQYHKINAAYAYGGINLLKSTVDEFLGIDIDYYLKINYNNFIDLVNLIEGVEIEIAKDLQYVDQAADLNIDLTAGKQMLNGEEALNYVRFRHDHLGDIGRIERQKKFLHAAADKLLSPASIFKLPELFNEVRNTIQTDLSLTNFATVAKLVKNFKSQELKITTLPGKAGYIKGISYWLVERQKLDDITNKFQIIEEKGG